MTIRERVDKEKWKEANRVLGKAITRIYFIWLAGIAVGVIGIKLEKFQIANITFLIEKPEVIQGLFFVAVCAYYLAIILFSFAVGILLGNADNTLKRRVLFLSLGNRKTLRGYNRNQIVFIKRTARGIHALVMICGVVLMFLPLAQIVLFELGSLLGALQEIFSIKL